MRRSLSRGGGVGRCKTAIRYRVERYGTASQERPFKNIAVFFKGEGGLSALSRP